VPLAYPQVLARTQNFRLGRPQRFTPTPDGRQLLFLRTRGGEDPVRCLWRLDLATGAETLLLDPLTLDSGRQATSAREQARRERARDRGAGIAEYSSDQDVRVAVASVALELHLVDLDSGKITALPARSPLTDATISPDGSAVAYVADGALRLIGADGTGDRALAEPEQPDVTYGLAEHVAAESMDRHRGYWWSPDGARLAVARVDESAVQTWYLSDPSNPSAPPTAHRYPPAGTTNASVSLLVLDRDGGRVEVDFGWPDYEYLVNVVWDAHGLLVVLQNRAQSVLRVHAVDPATGNSSLVAETTDAAYTTIVAGVPARTTDGSLIMTADLDGDRRLTVDGKPVTPEGLQVAEVFGVDGDTVVFGGTEEPTESHVWTWSAVDGVRQVTTEPGLHSATRSAGVTVISSATLVGNEVTVTGTHPRTVRSVAASSPVVPKVNLVRAGRRELRTAVLFPALWQRGERLPVLMDPYGGSAAQKAVADRSRYHASQWFADRGFAVIVADGRGTPGRGPAWERATQGKRSAALLEDQVDALHAVAALYPELDLSRVGIRGWSAGGYLAALAVLRRPDVFHAAVAGAPVTDPMLYDTHWEERELGDPRVDPGPYERDSLIGDAPNLTRPLMLIHGLGDDNVYPVHTMRLSAALLAAGRPHTVLPLPGASHIPPETDLLTPELIFLKQSLNIG
jgi:dipeptidyl-peptidase 4